MEAEYKDQADDTDGYSLWHELERIIVITSVVRMCSGPGTGLLASTGGGALRSLDACIVMGVRFSCLRGSPGSPVDGGEKEAAMCTGCSDIPLPGGRESGIEDDSPAQSPGSLPE